MNIIETLYQSLTEYKQTDNRQHRDILKECEKISDDIARSLSGEDSKKLILLSDTYLDLECVVHEEGFRQGFSSALKLIFSALLTP